ncbi:MAG: phosphatase PAP2 family protein [Thermoanaerobaculia bacterium]
MTAGPPREAGGLRRAVARRFSREEATGLSLTVGFLACALLVALFGLLAREIAVSGAGPLDRGVTLWSRGLPLPGGAAAARAITLLGDSLFVYPMTFLVAGLLAWRGRRVSAILFAASVVGGGLLEVLLKLVYARPRPDFVEPLVRVTSWSFPSGHATLATAFFGGLAAVVFHVTRRRAVRATAVASAALAAGSVSLSRVYLGVHWLTDVAAGALVGLFWVVVCATLTEVFARRSPSLASRESRASG